MIAALFRLFGWLGALAVVALVAAAGAFWWIERSGVQAPTDPGVCYRMARVGATPQFEPLFHGIRSLEICGAALERIHLTTGADVTGAYQGRFIFVDKTSIRSAGHFKGEQWRVFFDPQRDMLDGKLRPATPSTITVAPPETPPGELHRHKAAGDGGQTG